MLTVGICSNMFQNWWIWKLVPSDWIVVFVCIKYLHFWPCAFFYLFFLPTGIINNLGMLLWNTISSILHYAVIVLSANGVKKMHNMHKCFPPFPPPPVPRPALSALLWPFHTQLGFDAHKCKKCFKSHKCKKRFMHSQEKQ